MGTTIRPEPSKRNPYWIEKHRYYELKHFCLQYPTWNRIHASLIGLPAYSFNEVPNVNPQRLSNPTADYAVVRAYYSARIDMVRRVAEKTDPVLGVYILRGVTEGLSYDILKARLDIPCCKDTYYELYRKFFWLLSKERQ